MKIYSITSLNFINLCAILLSTDQSKPVKPISRPSVEIWIKNIVIHYLRAYCGTLLPKCL